MGCMHICEEREDRELRSSTEREIFIVKKHLCQYIK